MSKEGKYIIHASIRTDGTVARKDVIGAIFGQTEGLLGDELQLRKLQRTGRIGHVDVVLHQNKGQVQGEILVTSSLDQVSTAVIGAALETIERIGPCKSSIKVKPVKNFKLNQTKIDKAALEIVHAKKPVFILGNQVTQNKEFLPMFLKSVKK